MTKRTVYADNNATTQVAPEVVEAMVPFFNEHYGNPSSMHYMATPLRKKRSNRHGRRLPTL